MELLKIEGFDENVQNGGDSIVCVCICVCLCSLGVYLV